MRWRVGWCRAETRWASICNWRTWTRWRPYSAMKFLAGPPPKTSPGACTNSPFPIPTKRWFGSAGRPGFAARARYPTDNRLLLNLLGRHPEVLCALRRHLLRPGWQAGSGTRQRSALPHVVGKKAELRLLRHQHPRRGHALPGNLPLRLQLRFRLFEIIRFHLLGIGRLQLCEGLAHPRLARDIGRRHRGRDISFRGLYRREVGNGGIEDNALRPFAIGMNPNHRQIRVRPVGDRQLRQYCIRNE